VKQYFNGKSIIGINHSKEELFDSRGRGQIGGLQRDRHMVFKLLTGNNLLSISMGNKTK